MITCITVLCLLPTIILKRGLHAVVITEHPGVVTGDSSAKIKTPVHSFEVSQLTECTNRRKYTFEYVCSDKDNKYIILFCFHINDTSKIVLKCINFINILYT